jgi:hypothetical protein
MAYRRYQRIRRKHTCWPQVSQSRSVGGIIATVSPPGTTDTRGDLVRLPLYSCIPRIVLLSPLWACQALQVRAQKFLLFTSHSAKESRRSTTRIKTLSLATRITSVTGPLSPLALASKGFGEQLHSFFFRSLLLPVFLSLCTDSKPPLIDCVYREGGLPSYT